MVASAIPLAHFSRSVVLPGAYLLLSLNYLLFVRPYKSIFEIDVEQNRQDREMNMRRRIVMEKLLPKVKEIQATKEQNREDLPNFDNNKFMESLETVLDQEILMKN